MDERDSGLFAKKGSFAADVIVGESYRVKLSSTSASSQPSPLSVTPGHSQLSPFDGITRVDRSAVESSQSLDSRSGHAGRNRFGMSAFRRRPPPRCRPSSRINFGFRPSGPRASIKRKAGEESILIVEMDGVQPSCTKRPFTASGKVAVRVSEDQMNRYGPQDALSDQKGVDIILLDVSGFSISEENDRSFWVSPGRRFLATSKVGYENIFGADSLASVSERLRSFEAS